MFKCIVYINNFNPFDFWTTVLGVCVCWKTIYGSLSGFSSFFHQINFVAHRNWIFFWHEYPFLFQTSTGLLSTFTLKLPKSFASIACHFYPISLFIFSEFFFSGIKFKFGVLWIVVESSKIDRDFETHREYWHQPKWIHDTDKILTHVTEKCKHPTNHFVNVINFKLSHK